MYLLFFLHIVAAGLMLVEFMVVKMYQLERIVSIKVSSCTRYSTSLDAFMNTADPTETTISIYTLRILNLVRSDTCNIQ